MIKALLRRFFLVLTVGLISNNAFAEFYQWTDANGTVHFSDSPVNAPKNKPPIVRRDEMNESPSTPRNQSTPKVVQQPLNKEQIGSKTERLPEQGQFDDSSLVSMWNSMISCISRGDTTTALSYIHPRARQQYKQMFNALKPKLPEIMATRRNFALLQSGERRATYELTTSEAGGNYSYEVVFVKDDSKWWIYEF